jgi:cobalt-precorrin-7 (C5)-methyltransferase
MIYLVGMGPGHINYMTRDAIEIVTSVDRCVAFGRIAETAKQITRNVTTVNKLDDVIKHLKGKGDVAVLASGDACFYGILDFLQGRQITISQIVPGLTSFQYMMSRLQLSWQNAVLFSLHGRKQNYYEILHNELSVILTDKHNTPEFISKKLFELGGKGKIYAGYDLSYESEIIVEKELGEPIPNISNLATIVVEIESPNAA